MNRRKFLIHSGLLTGTTTLLPLSSSCKNTTVALNTWEKVRAQFQFTPDRIHLSQMLFAAHPAPVRAAIEKHRKAFDENPVEYVEENFLPAIDKVKESAAKYLEVKKEEIVLTDSTTMGLALLYHGLQLKEGEEVLTSTHAHFSTHKSLDYAAARTGALIRKIDLYKDPSQTSVSEMIDSIRKAIGPQTRVLALTWVHSSTGVKTPVKEISAYIQSVNAGRSAKDRIYVCVDGVHGFGIDNITMKDLGCDFFVAGTHKWLFGPRGTGILWGREEAWEIVRPTIPAFREKPYIMWMGYIPEGPVEFSNWITPGGYHAFEHRWALKEAFDFHLTIGKERIQTRTQALNTRLKTGLKDIKKLKLHTPLSPEISAGINCFEVPGLQPKEVVSKLSEKKIIATVSPYRISYPRLTPSIINTKEEVDIAIACMREICA